MSSAFVQILTMQQRSWQDRTFYTEGCFLFVIQYEIMDHLLNRAEIHRLVLLFISGWTGCATLYQQ